MGCRELELPAGCGEGVDVPSRFLAVSVRDTDRQASRRYHNDRSNFAAAYAVLAPPPPAANIG